MPALYTHDRFGTLVTREARGDLKQIILKHNLQFRTGLQGPDPLFFYKAYSGNRVRRYGTYLHEVSALPFLRHAASIIRKTGRDTKEYAYLLGYICHFVLDSECHPYVDEAMNETGVGHLQIESEFEKYLLRSENHDPIKYPLSDMMADDLATAEAMDPFYPSISLQELHTSLRYYKFVKWLFHAESPLREHITNQILKLTGKYDSMRGLMHALKDIPECEESNLELERRFDHAVELAAELLEDFDAYVMYGIKLPDRFDRNFE